MRIFKGAGYELHQVKDGYIAFLCGYSRVQKLENDFRLSEKEIVRTVKNSINGALILLRNEIVRMARKKYNLDDYFFNIKKRIHIRKATARRYYDGSLFVYSAKWLPLVYYLPKNTQVPNYKGIAPSRRQPKGGIRVKIFRDEAPMVMRGPEGQTNFLAELKSKYRYSRATNIALFYRYGPDNFWDERRGTDIAELWGPSPVNIIFDEKQQPKILEKADELLDYKIHNIVARTIEKKLGRRR